MHTVCAAQKIVQLQDIEDEKGPFQTRQVQHKNIQNDDPCQGAKRQDGNYRAMTAAGHSENQYGDAGRERDQQFE